MTFHPLNAGPPRAARVWGGCALRLGGGDDAVGSFNELPSARRIFQLDCGNQAFYAGTRLKESGIVPIHQAEEFRRELERNVRAEVRSGWDNVGKRWAKPLPERLAACRAIGWLLLTSIETLRNRKLVHLHPSVDDMAHFREGDSVRMSLNDPDGGNFIGATFLGLTEKGLSVTVSSESDVIAMEGWCLDEGIFDISEFHLRALDEMASIAGDYGTDLLSSTTGHIDYGTDLLSSRWRLRDRPFVIGTLTPFPPIFPFSPQRWQLLARRGR